MAIVEVLPKIPFKAVHVGEMGDYFDVCELLDGVPGVSKVSWHGDMGTILFDSAEWICFWFGYWVVRSSEGKVWTLTEDEFKERFGDD